MIGNELYKFPISYVRLQFPALKRTYKGKPVVYLDGPGGTQVVDTAIKEITNYMLKGSANLRGQFPSSIETEVIIREAKKAIADMFGVKTNEIAFGANTTTLELAISRAIARDLKSGDEIVLSELDHSSNIDPWLEVARDKGINVRWLKVKKDNLTLDLSELYSVINEKTRVVAVGLASNAIGTINEIEIISARAKSVGAIVVVDAVHAAPHFSVNRNKFGADILLCSAYKFFGPHIGIAIIEEEIFKKLNTYKLKSAPDYIPDKLETGTQNHESIAGIKPAIEFIASLGSGNTRKEKLVSAFERIEAYENRLASKIRKRLGKLPKVRLYQSPEWVRKTPTIAFRIDGMLPQEACKFMAEECSVFATNGDFYASTLADKLAVNKTGGWIRIGLAPYNSEEEIEYFINVIKNLVN